MEDFEQFERELHALFVRAERDVLGHELSQLDVDLPYVLIDGVKHCRVLRSVGNYTSAAGSISVLHTLYRSGRDKAVVPMEYSRWYRGRSLDAAGGQTGGVDGGPSNPEGG